MVRPDRARANAIGGRWPGAAPLAVVLAVLAVLAAPGPALAHIKWFAPCDVTLPPKTLGNVLDGRFGLALAGFTILLAASFLLDRVALRRAPLLARRGRTDAIEDRLVRAGIGGYFMALFATGGAILTFELQTAAAWPAWLQLGIAASMMSAPTCVLGGVGIVALYGFGVWQYGAFHLCDYPLFLGLAAYAGLLSTASKRWRALRMPILQGSFCISLMWGAVEKWAYPQWSFPLLADRPYLTFGLPQSTFMILAGFVEFAFAFYILAGLGLQRLAIAGLLAIFSAAILDFGKPDAIGHLPFLVTMAAMLLHGPTEVQAWLHAGRGRVVQPARAGPFAFAATLGVMVTAYYGMQSVEYGHPTPSALHADAAHADRPHAM